MSGLIEVLTGNRNTQPDFVSTDNPVPVTQIGGTLAPGSATAANQALEIADLDAIKASLAGTLPVSVATLPLPSGAATSAHQVLQTSDLDAIKASLAGTLQVSAVVLPLPTGAATSANQTSQLSQETATAAALGTTADVAWAGGGATSTVVAALKKIVNTLLGVITVSPIASATTGGIPSVFRLVSCAASTNGNLIKSSQGQVYYIIAYNAATTVRYLKLYNKGTIPAPGTDTPVLTIPIPAGGGIALDVHLGLNLFANGIGMGITTLPADNDASAAAAGDLVGINIGYA